MTAEVAILNKTAVALAADSAMTLSESGKTYPADKLFSLGPHHEIGVMIYNNAEFMGVPWETLVKMYRDELGTSPLGTTEAYAEGLINSICNTSVVTPRREIDNLKRILRDRYASVGQLAEAACYDLADQGRLTARAEATAFGVCRSRHADGLGGSFRA